ncbi:Very-short-patch-repair endonuclease [Bosea lathyri]|uniref:Very-short-patch-repair endonuclease n=2 Tax=Bosea lathyri TaxID=1036778 RepID=A0A1H6D5I6_9HYPH|nr:Very-short-patch-repair endonuclease [Bosea lathyri]
MVSEQQNFARSLRKRSTKPEDIIWDALRNRRIDGLKFRRQSPLLNYTVDFLCFERKLIIEIDGKQHGRERDYDMARTVELESHGFTVLRVRNDEVLGDLDAVIGKIRVAARI